MRTSTLLIVLVLAVAAIVGWWTTTGRHLPDADFVFVSAAPHKTLDPQQMSWRDEIRVAECLYEPLVKFDIQGRNVVAGVAERWDVDPTEQGEEYTFHLRADAGWSNGDPVTSHDFVYAWRRAMLPDFAAQYFNLMWIIDGAREFYDWRNEQLLDYEKRNDRSADVAQELWQEALARFEQTVGLWAPNDHTLVVHLKRPTPYFLELCAFATFMPVHRATVDTFIEGPDPATGRMKQRPWVVAGQVVSNGPYVLSERKIKEYLLMKANPHYWSRSAMGNSSILERIIENAQTALLAYGQGEIDWLPDTPIAKSLAADLVAAGRSDVHVVPRAGTYFYRFNCATQLPDGSKNPLGDPRVRRALAMSIDRKRIVESVTRMEQPVANAFTPVGEVPGYDPPVDAGARFDPERAGKLLSEAGYADRSLLKGLSILYNTGQGHEQIAQFVQQSWRTHLKIHIELEGIEKKVFSDRSREHRFTIARGGWFGDYRDPTTFLDLFRTGGGQNDGQYSNPQFDRLMDQAMFDRDPGKRMAILREAEALMLREQAVAPILQYVELEIFDERRVTGLALNAWHRRRLDLVRVR